jgi:large subunit ribosomal protein L25
MTTNAVQLDLEPRELFGRKVSRLRRAGIVPVHLYGPGIEPRALQCPGPRLINALSQAGASTPISIKIAGESGTHLAFAREIQWDPRRDDLLHVDLLAADASRPVTAQVNIVMSGESAGARSVSGTVMQQLRTIDVQALPMEMPAQAEIDLTTLTEPDSVIRVGDIVLSDTVTVLTDPEEVVARIELPRTAEELVPDLEAGETVAGGDDAKSPSAE